MNKKLIGAAGFALLLAGSSGPAMAGHTDDGTGHKPQDRGLCTAFFNGNKNGWEKNGYPPPFQDLVSRSEENAPSNNDEDPDNDVEGAEAVAEFCGDLVGGNPGPNGNSGGKGKGGN